jgi:hypothetical protein
MDFYQEISTRSKKGTQVWSNKSFIDSWSLKEPFFVDPQGKRSNSTAFTAAHHGRSVFLGEFQYGDSTCHVFAKGCGWSNGLVQGWCPELGNLGLFNKAAAMHEVEVSIALNDINIRTITPMEVWEYDSIPDAMGGKDRSPDSISDLYGNPACPSLFVYASSSKYRLCELPLLHERERLSVIGELLSKFRKSTIEDYLLRFAGVLGEFTGKLHSVGGHNYAASTHNVFLDGTLIDFEYVYLPKFPTQDPNINQRPDSWMDKELLGWWDTISSLKTYLPCAVGNGELISTFFNNYRDHGGRTNLDMYRYFSQSM